MSGAYNPLTLDVTQLKRLSVPFPLTLTLYILVIQKSSVPSNASLEINWIHHLEIFNGYFSEVGWQVTSQLPPVRTPKVYFYYVYIGSEIFYVKVGLHKLGV